LSIKIQKLLSLLLAIPLCVGLFCGQVLATSCKEFADESASYEITCETAESCETEILDIEKKDVKQCNDEIKELQRKIDELVYNTDVMGYLPARRSEMETKRESMSKIYENKIIPLKVSIQSKQNIDAEKILSIAGQTHFLDANDFLGKVIDLLVKFVGLMAFVFLVIGGFRLMVAAGDDNEIQKAKSMITYSIMGLVVALLAYIIVAGVQGILYR
jgi:hypothetical protein